MHHFTGSAQSRFPLSVPNTDSKLEHYLNFEFCDLTDQVGNLDATLQGGASCTQGQGIVLDGTQNSEYISLANNINVLEYADTTEGSYAGMTIAMVVKWGSFETWNWGGLASGVSILTRFAHFR